MRLLGRRFSAALFFTAMSVVLVAQPAAAQPAAGTNSERGTTGDWFLVDSSSGAGADCDYDSNVEIDYITVHAPYVFATQTLGTQRVGWQFTIQRQQVGPGVSAWGNRYTSRTFKAYASTSSEANFVAKGVRVIVPFSEVSYFRYRAVVKLFWYWPDGSLQGSASTKVRWYDEYADRYYLRSGYCDSFE